MGKRIAIVIAGPLANLALCVAMLWAMFVVGRPDYAPVLGLVEAIAADSGLRRGDTLLQVDGRDTPTWSGAALELTMAAMDRTDVPVAVRTADGGDATRSLRLSRLPDGFDEQRALQLIGVTPRHRLQSRWSAGRALARRLGRLAEGDRIPRSTATDRQLRRDRAAVQKLASAVVAHDRSDAR